MLVFFKLMIHHIWTVHIKLSDTKCSSNKRNGPRIKRTVVNMHKQYFHTEHYLHERPEHWWSKILHSFKRFTNIVVNDVYVTILQILICTRFAIISIWSYNLSYLTLLFWKMFSVNSGDWVIARKQKPNWIASSRSWHNITIRLEDFRIYFLNIKGKSSLSTY